MGVYRYFEGLLPGLQCGEKLQQSLGIITLGEALFIKNFSLDEDLVRVEKAIRRAKFHLRLIRQQRQYFPEHTCGSAFTHRYRAGNTDDAKQLLLITS